MATTTLPKIISLQEIEKVISSPSFALALIHAIEQGFIDSNKFNAAPIQTLGAPPLAPFSTSAIPYSAQTCIKSGYVTDADHFVVKVAAGGAPMPKNTGNLQVYSQATGRLEYLLLDEGILTEHRTAAAGAVAAKSLAAQLVSRIGMVGTGVQARYQLRYLQHVTSCRDVLVWGRTQAHVLAYKADMETEGWSVQIAKDPSEIVTTCDLVVTTTSGREPILKNHPNRHKPQHITCIGADAPGKQELDPTLIQEADLLIADALVQTKVRGEFQTVLQNETVPMSSIVELGDFLVKNDTTSRSCWTIFDSSGVAFQDCAVASLVGSHLA